jgi:SAM-dependent methyltransferase
VLTLEARILDIWAAREEHGGSCQDIAELVTQNGPGMQARWRGKPTEFWADIPFIRFVSVEYLIKPQEVFAEVRRVLRPGGRFVVTFSNRWFPPKVIKVWQDVHEFERVGLVMEYFLRDGGFINLQTWSMRGLPRPLDDKYAGRMAQSDPIYAVWGEKAP